MADNAESAKKRKATTREPHIMKGTRDDRDPDHMLATTSREEAAEWFQIVRNTGLEARTTFEGARGGGVKRNYLKGKERVLFSDWDRRFFASIEAQFAKHIAEGRTQFLTGPQLCGLKRMVNLIAAEGRAALQQVG
jgi:hypothetical protein